MPPESGGICWRLTSDLPLGCLQVLHDHTAVVGLLLAAGADVFGKAGKGETPLHYSVHNPAIALRLLEAGANVSGKTLNGETALLLASRHGQVLWCFVFTLTPPLPRTSLGN